MTFLKMYFILFLACFVVVFCVCVFLLLSFFFYRLILDMTCFLSNISIMNTNDLYYYRYNCQLNNFLVYTLMITKGIH